MAFWKNFFSKSVTLPISEVVKQACELVRPGIGTPYSDADSINKYRSWVYVASSYNARAVATADIELYTTVPAKAARTSKVTKKQLDYIRSISHKAMENVERVEAHPIIDLLSRPNKHDNSYSFFYKVDLFLELTGDAYILVTRNSNGIPVELNLLYSQYVNIQTDGLNKVIAYNYGIATNGKWDYQFSPDEIIHIKFFDPSNVLYGISPLEACARSYGLIESTTTYEEAINRNMGVVSGILKHKSGKIKPEQRAEVEAKWQRKFAGVGRSGKVVVTDADIDYTNIGISPRDMQFLDGRKWCREEILACYGVSPALLFTSDVNRSNMEVATLNYYHNTVTPRLRLISQSITTQLINTNGISGDDMFFALRRDPPSDNELNLKRAALLTESKAITVNELREMFGTGPLEGEDGNKIVDKDRGIQDG